MVLLIRRLAILLLLLCLGCSAQSNPAEVNHRVERLVRNHYSLPPSVDVKVTNRAPSKDFSQYDQVTIKMSRGDQSTNRDFLISKDSQKLFQFAEVVDPLGKIDLANRPYRGNKDAKVTLVNYDDFQCPYCSRNHQELMSAILKQYGDRIRIVYKDFPLYEIHPWAIHAAVDSNCLAAQNNDAYWDYADYLHGNQHSINGTREAQFAELDKQVTLQAQKHSLDVPKLQACVKAQDERAVRASMREGEALEVSATPQMFVNGQKVEGAVPPETLREVLDRALKDAGVAPPDHKAAAGGTTTPPAPSAK